MPTLAMPTLGRLVAWIAVPGVIAACDRYPLLLLEGPDAAMPVDAASSGSGGAGGAGRGGAGGAGGQGGVGGGGRGGGGAGGAGGAGGSGGTAGRGGTGGIGGAGAGGTPDACALSACGGVPTGAWTLAGVCLSSPPALPGPPCATDVLEVASSGQGRWILMADAQYQLLLTISSTVTLERPTSCLSGQTCAALGVALGGACTDATAGCHCTIERVVVQRDEVGTYAVAGSQVVTTAPSGETRFDHCVDGPTMNVRWDGVRASLRRD